ncbi:MAG: hypothetical protein HRU22_12770 [Gammaproteobacteria bacterium]|nr:hypothetical protein [Gammaproteobacteria bacterium]
MKISNNVIKVSLIMAILAVVSINSLMIYQDYQAKISIKSDSIYGSNLAARYLVLGDWPASQSNDHMITHFADF